MSHSRKTIATLIGSWRETLKKKDPQKTWQTFQDKGLKHAWRHLQLNEHEKRNILIKETYKFLADKSITSRVFNPFLEHNLLLADDLFFSSCAKRFSWLLQKIEYISITSENIFPRDPKDRKHVENWARKIISYCCEMLLNKDGSLKRELIDFLKWHPYASRLDEHRIQDIVCGFFSILYMQIVINLKEHVETKKDIYTAIDIYINRHKAIWLQEEIAKNYKKIEPKIIEAKPITLPEAKPITLPLAIKLPETPRDSEDDYVLVQDKIVISPKSAASITNSYYTLFSLATDTLSSITTTVTYSIGLSR